MWAVGWILGLEGGEKGLLRVMRELDGVELSLVGGCVRKSSGLEVGKRKTRLIGELASVLGKERNEARGLKTGRRSGK